jgi:hypothetical protein
MDAVLACALLVLMFIWNPNGDDRAQTTAGQLADRASYAVRFRIRPPGRRRTALRHMSNQQAPDPIQTALSEVIALISENRSGEAVEKIVAFRARNNATRDLLIRSLISIGQAYNNATITRCALSAFERVKSKAASHY